VFRTFTGAGRVRHTAWRGLREDRKPAEVTAPGRVPELEGAGAALEPTGTAAGVEEPAAPAPPALGQKVTVQAGNRRLTLSNLDKVLYRMDSPRAR
jgi:bifunctional non-homologous end joining protein LigD